MSSLQLKCDAMRSCIVKLQEDILIQIFKILAEDYPLPRDACNTSWGWERVIEVCQYWNTVATKAPMLWSHLHTFDSVVKTKKFLLLSKNSDLTVQYTRSQGMRKKVTIHNLITILEEMRRIRHLYIDVSQDPYDSTSTELRCVYSLLEQPAPRLQSLTLELAGNAERPLVKLPRSPLLKRAEMCNISLFPSAFYFFRLSVLSIQNCSNFSFSDVLGVLETNPELEGLIIESCDIESSLVPRAVHLTHLLNIKLDLEQTVLCLDFIQCLEVPNLFRWEVQCNDLVLDEVPKIYSISKLLVREYDIESVHLFTLCIESAEIIEVHIYGDSSKPNSEEAVLKLLHNVMDLNAVLSCLIEIFSKHLEKAKDLTIRRAEDFVAVDIWCKLFRALVRVKTIGIEIGLGDNHGRNLLNGLAMQNQLICHTQEAPCHKLEDIFISWFGETPDLDLFLHTLEYVLRERSTQGSALGKLYVYSHSGIVEDEEIRKLSQWARDYKWVSKSEREMGDL